MLLSESCFREREFGDTPDSRSPQKQPIPVFLDDVQAAVWVRVYDAAWLGRKWDILEALFTSDITLVSTELVQPLVGRTAVLDHLRDTMSRAHVHEYNTTDLKGYTSGSVGIITYRWQLDWSADGERRSGSGRDILVLQPASGDWQLAWRAQTVRHRPGAEFAYGWRGDWG